MMYDTALKCYGTLSEVSALGDGALKGFGPFIHSFDRICWLGLPFSSAVSVDSE